jgi:hypothetical protein
MSTPKPKLRPRRMWANYYPHGVVGIHVKRSTAKYFRGFLAGPIIPVAVIPLHEPTALGDSMVSALTDLGVLRKPRKGGRK